MKQVVLYPSGYVGYDVGWPVVRTEQNFDAARALARFDNVSTRDKLSISNTTIEGLWKQWRARARDFTCAEFISDVCAAVANAFGTTSFYEWCHMQMSNPYFTADHRQYLNETLHFITGTPRTFSHAVWFKTLAVRRAGANDLNEPFDYQQVLLRSGDMSNTTVLNIMARWIGQPNGIEDLLTFAHIVFGDAS